MNNNLQNNLRYKALYKHEYCKTEISKSKSL